MKEEFCEYCDPDVLGREDIESVRNAMYAKVIPVQKMLYMHCDECGEEDYVKINYCPMCGRKL